MNSKPLSDYPWFRFHIARFVTATMGMSDSEVGQEIRRVIDCWVNDRGDDLPQWAKEAAKERFDKTTIYSGNASANANNCSPIAKQRLATLSNTSLSLSSLSSDSWDRGLGKGASQDSVPIDGFDDDPPPPPAGSMAPCVPVSTAMGYPDVPVPARFVGSMVEPSWVSYVAMRREIGRPLVREQEAEVLVRQLLTLAGTDEKAMCATLDHATLERAPRLPTWVANNVRKRPKVV